MVDQETQAALHELEERLRVDFEQKLNKERKEIVEIFMKPPHIRMFLEFIHQRRVTNRYEMEKELKTKITGGTITRLHEALKSTENYQLLIGSNRYVSQLYIYHDGTFFNDGHPLVRAIFLNFYLAAKPLGSRQPNHGTGIVDAKRIETWITEQTGNGDLAKATVKGMWQDETLKDVMRGRVKFTPSSMGFWRVA